jgi:dUTP pyrophosphatase
MLLKFKKLSPNAVIPKYAKANDAGLDLTCTGMTFDTSNGSIIYSTGLAVAIPKGHVGLLFPRSSISKKSLVLSNSVGCVDAGYRGEIKAVFRNTGSMWYNVGDRICQLVVMPFPEMEPVEVSELDETERGTGGFGSSGA